MGMAHDTFSPFSTSLIVPFSLLADTQFLDRLYTAETAYVLLPLPAEPETDGEGIFESRARTPHHHLIRHRTEFP